MRFEILFLFHILSLLQFVNSWINHICIFLIVWEQLYVDFYDIFEDMVAMNLK